MKNNKNTITDTIDQLANNYDLHELNQFAQGLSPSEIQLYKTELTDAYLRIFSMWHYDWVCDKIETDPADPESFVRDFMLGLVDDAERIVPGLTLYAERGDCYRLLAEFPATPETRLAYLQQAIEIYQKAVKNAGFTQLHSTLANTLLDRMQLTGQFEAPVLEEALQHYQSAFATFSEHIFSQFLNAAFRLLNLDFADKWQWHNRFLNELSVAATRFAEQDSFVYLIWFNGLTGLLRYDENKLPADYAEEIQKKSIELLAYVQNYKTENQDRLNRLGSAFEWAAKQTTDVSEKLFYHETALKFFTQGQYVNPAAWTFPVYATNVLMAMAKIYQQQQDTEKVIELFEAGKGIFAKNTHPNDFQLVIYWGDFLVEYARLAHNFQSPEILREAENKLLIAKEQGKQHYSRPYLSLAKVALKLGDKAKCLSILQECQTLFGKYYDRHPALEDEDFREVWLELG
jgi:hypothetical protein